MERATGDDDADSAAAVTRGERWAAEPAAADVPTRRSRSVAAVAASCWG